MALLSSFNRLGRSERLMNVVLVVVLNLQYIVVVVLRACSVGAEMLSIKQTYNPVLVLVLVSDSIHNLSGIMGGLGGNDRVVSRNPRRCPGRG